MIEKIIRPRGLRRDNWSGTDAQWPSVGEFKWQALNWGVSTAVVVSESAKQWRLVCWWLGGIRAAQFSGVNYWKCWRENCHTLSRRRLQTINTSHCVCLCVCAMSRATVKRTVVHTSANGYMSCLRHLQPQWWSYLLILRRSFDTDLTWHFTMLQSFLFHWLHFKHKVMLKHFAVNIFRFHTSCMNLWPAFKDLRALEMKV